jgi:AdoMet-dependent rRNA methyltransferase SPB1
VGEEGEEEVDPELAGGELEEGEGEEGDEEAAAAARLEAELEESYQTYLSNRTGDGRAVGTRAAKRAKAAQAAMAAERMGEDMAMYDGELSGYVELLSGKTKGEDSDSEESSDTESEGEEEEEEEESAAESQSESEEDDDEEEEEEEEEEGQGKKGKRQHPLLVDPEVFAGVEKSGAKVARWFSNPVFKSLGVGLEDGDDEEGEGEGSGMEEPFDDEEEESEEEEAAAPPVGGKRKKEGGSGSGKGSGGKGGKFASVAEEVLASMPKTDKQVRHEKRMKARERRERRALKKQRLADPDAEEEERALELVAAGDEGDVQEQDPVAAERARKRREMIRAGMGAALEEGEEEGEGKKKKGKGKDGKGFEVVPVTGPASSMRLPKGTAAGGAGMMPMPPVADERRYDSEHEEWDEEERARTLAIATMMLRRSKAKELVDASYNRYAWNDAGDLPEWFVDDEERHYRPQIPVPKPLMDEMKERFKTLAAKPIAKVGPVFFFSEFGKRGCVDCGWVMIWRDKTLGLCLNLEPAPPSTRAKLTSSPVLNSFSHPTHTHRWPRPARARSGARSCG